MNQTQNPPLIAIVGETASGKTSLGISLAQKFNGEIINADSWAIYRGMNVGTAKPTKAEQALVPHHLIDIVDPDANYTAAVFKDQAMAAIADISSRDKLPIMVGGSGLYVDGVLYDYSFADEGNPELRAELDALSIPELIQRAEAEGIDLVNIDVRNKRRIVRAIESRGEVPRSSKLRDNTLVIGLRLDRGKLRQRIEDRVEEMFRRGLKKEVVELAEKYGWEAEAMKGIGYREFQDYHAGKISQSQLKVRIVRNTLQRLAKPQRTWFKRHPEIVWVDDPAEAHKLVAASLAQ